MKKLIGCVLLASLLMSNPAHAGDTIVARVGDRIITIEDLQKTVNSTPYGIPDVRQIQPDKREIVLDILQKMISAELLYDEAIRLDIPKSALFRAESRRYRTGLLAGLYRQNLAQEAVEVDAAEVERLAAERSVSETEARGFLANQHRKKRFTAESERLFDRYAVKYSQEVAQKDPDAFSDDDVLVTASAFKITFGDIKQALNETGGTKARLMDILAQTVEQELFAARAVELKLDAGVAADIEAYEKSLAVTLLREQLERENGPQQEETDEYIRGNEYLLYKPQTAHVLMIVTVTEKEATSMRRQALAGGNFFELASKHSIAPDAKVRAGRMDPLIIGERPYTVIDKALLALKPGGITHPIRGDKGFSIFKLLDITPRERREEREVREDAARIIREQKMAAHIAALLQTTRVEIYPVASSDQK
ncbi:MAG: peptidyl-prolyl cis-trans isomerase [Nitrospirae bacterium]|nr:peptidyl-prolyl cis-trans isomerase [Nitrospirota bacterium]